MCETLVYRHPGRCLYRLEICKIYWLCRDERLTICVAGGRLTGQQGCLVHEVTSLQSVVIVQFFLLF